MAYDPACLFIGMPTKKIHMLCLQPVPTVPSACHSQVLNITYQKA